MRDQIALFLNALSDYETGHQFWNRLRAFVIAPGLSEESDAILAKQDRQCEKAHRKIAPARKVVLEIGPTLAEWIDRQGQDSTPIRQVVIDAERYRAPKSSGDESRIALERMAAMLGKASAKNQCEVQYLGGCRLRIGKRTVTLTPRQDTVLFALIGLGAASKGDLETTSGYDDAVRVLRKLVKDNPKLKKWITFPGAKGRGGYQTTIPSAE